MKKLSLNIYLAALCCLFSFINASSQNTGNFIEVKDNAIIALLAETPQETIENCTGEDLMQLLTDVGKQWIKSIDCKNVNIVKGSAGAQLILNQSTDYNSYIQFNFKSDKQPQATNVTFYGSDKEAEGYVKAIVSVNKSAYSTYYNNVNYFYVNSANLTKIESASADQLLESIKNNGNSTTPLPARIVVNSLPSENRVESCRIEYNSKADVRADNIKIFALRVYYNGIYDVTNEEIQTGINNISAEDQNIKIEYYDLYGRVLSKAPEKGIYLRREGGKTTKHIAY